MEDRRGVRAGRGGERSCGRLVGLADGERVRVVSEGVQAPPVRVVLAVAARVAEVGHAGERLAFAELPAMRQTVKGRFAAGDAWSALEAGLVALRVVRPLRCLPGGVAHARVVLQGDDAGQVKAWF